VRQSINWIFLFILPTDKVCDIARGNCDGFKNFKVDGNEIIVSIGWMVWAIVNDAGGKWLGIWVVPSNCLSHIIAYLYL
jgi:hypothetical protein